MAFNEQSPVWVEEGKKSNSLTNSNKIEYIKKPQCQKHTLLYNIDNYAHFVRDILHFAAFVIH